MQSLALAPGQSIAWTSHEADAGVPSAARWGKKTAGRIASRM